MDPILFSDEMPPLSGRPPGHRRAHSETFLRIPDDGFLDPDFDFNIADLDFSSLSDDGPAPSDSGRSESSSGLARRRSLSVDEAFFDGLAIPPPSPAPASGRHRRSGSFDGGEPGASFDYGKKAIAADRLAELALIDPKRAKRILANRHSAARSKARRVQHTNELERRVQTLQKEATTLSAQVTRLQRDTTGLTTENRELKLRLQALEQEAQLREALEETLRGDLQLLRIASGQIPIMDRTTMKRGVGYQSQQQFHGLPPLPSNSQLQLQPNSLSCHESQHFRGAPLPSNPGQQQQFCSQTGQQKPPA